VPLLGDSEPALADVFWRYRGQVQTGAKFNHDSPSQSTANPSIVCKSFFTCEYHANHRLFSGLNAASAQIA
jgi:hypothetical protein